MANQIPGSIGDELLLGTPEPDDIRGDGDTLSGVGVNAGADTILALGGADTVFGDAQTLTEGARGGNDAIFGDGGNDALYGDAAVFGSPAFPPGGGGPPIPTMGGDDLIEGGAGNDTIWGDAAEVPSAGVFGADTVRGDGGDDLVFGDTERSPSLAGVPGDLILGGAGDDTLYGDVRLIQLTGPLGAGDTILGGAGNDLIYGDGFTHVLLVGPPGARLPWGGISDVTTGSASDTLEGGAGDDTIVGDVAIASNGGAGRDLLDGGAGNDVLYGDGINQYLVFMGDDTLRGGDGSDVLYGDAARAALALDTGPGIDLGRAGSDLLEGGAGRDFLYGDAPVLFAPNGPLDLGRPLQVPGAADTLDGGAGADVMFGGGGPDLFILRRGETQGDEIVDFSGQGGDGDSIRFEGFGAGATVAQDGAFTVVTAADGSAEHFRLQGGATLGEGDFVFV